MMTGIRKIVTIILCVSILCGCDTLFKKKDTAYEVFQKMLQANTASELKKVHESVYLLSLNDDMSGYSIYDDKTEVHYVEKARDENVLYASIKRKDFLFELRKDGSFVQNLVLDENEDGSIWDLTKDLQIEEMVPENVTYTDSFTILKVRLGLPEGTTRPNADHIEETYLLDSKTNVINSRKQELFFKDGSSENLFEEEYRFDEADPDAEYIKQLDEHFKSANYDRNMTVVFDKGLENERQTTYKVVTGDQVEVIASGKQVIDQDNSVFDDIRHSRDLTFYVYSNGEIPKPQEDKPEEPVVEIRPEEDSSGFVLLSEAVPDAILEIRYYSTYNFVGERIDGYEEPLAFLTKEAAAALKQVSDEVMAKGYRLKIYDAYRPQKAVDHFVRWSKTADTAMKEYFYPELDKSVLFKQGYILEKSGHSRGSTVDLTLFDMATGKELDMGGTFDYFGELSHPDYKDITEEQYNNRMILREAMLAHGFNPLDEEWWHFTLKDEPYPDTYFNFPINSDQLNKQ